jgi:hypothetical protein
MLNDEFANFQRTADSYFVIHNSSFSNKENLELRMLNDEWANFQ